MTDYRCFTIDFSVRLRTKQKQCCMATRLLTFGTHANSHTLHYKCVCVESFMSFHQLLPAIRAAVAPHHTVKSRRLLNFTFCDCMTGVGGGDNTIGPNFADLISAGLTIPINSGSRKLGFRTTFNLLNETYHVSTS